MYEPREDSFLLQKEVSKYAIGDVLDMCTGSGIIAKEAAKTADQVVGLDINPKCIEYCEKQIKDNNVTFLVSDLFEVFKDKNYKFDLITINPPYLPDEPKAKDIALDGGKQGYEFIEKFIKQAKHYLKEDGKILLLFSSLTQKDKVDEIIKKNNFKHKQISSLKLDFEELFVYLLK